MSQNLTEQQQQQFNELDKRYQHAAKKAAWEYFEALGNNTRAEAISYAQEALAQEGSIHDYFEEGWMDPWDSSTVRDAVEACANGEMG